MVLKPILDKFTYSEFPNEMHACGNLTGRPYQFAGPHTPLDLRLGRNDRPKH